MLLWVMIIGFAVMSIVFLCGKGGFLIAGYNTANNAEKAMYDEKKLCRVTGVGTLIMTLSLLIAQLNEDLASYSVITGVIIGILIMFIGSKTYAKKSNYEWVETKKEETKWYKNKKFFSSVFTVIILIVVGVLLFTGDVKIDLKDNSLTASAFLSSSTTVEYQDIEKVELQENIEIGSRTWGVGSLQLVAGNFKNDAFGKYKLYAYTKCKSYVVLKTEDGYVVINDSTDEKTKMIYEKILQVMQ